MKKALIHSRLLHHLPYENPSKTELKINIVPSKAQKAALGVPAYTANQALADKGTTNTIEELITAPKITQLQRLRDSEQGIQILRSLGYEVREEYQRKTQLTPTATARIKIASLPNNMSTTRPNHRAL